MAEQDPRLVEYRKSFGPRERAMAIISIALEYTEQIANLPPVEKEKYEGYLEALKT